MRINIEAVDHVTVVELTGELDSATAPDVAQQVMPLAQSQDKILVDMHEVTYMSSAGLRVLLLLYRKSNEKHGHIILSGLKEDIKDIMSMTGFLEFFVTSEDRATGLDALKLSG